MFRLSIGLQIKPPIFQSQFWERILLKLHLVVSQCSWIKSECGECGHAGLAKSDVEKHAPAAIRSTFHTLLLLLQIKPCNLLSFYFGPKWEDVCFEGEGCDEFVDVRLIVDDEKSKGQNYCKVFSVKFPVSDQQLQRRDTWLWWYKTYI